MIRYREPRDLYDEWVCPQHREDPSGYGQVQGQWLLPNGTMGTWRVDASLETRVICQHVPAIKHAPPEYRVAPWGEGTFAPTEAVTPIRRLKAHG